MLDLHGWRALLGDAAAHEAYLQVDAAALSPESISRFLMLDPRFPRSVAFCLGEVESAIEDLIAMDAMAAEPGAPRAGAHRPRHGRGGRAQAVGRPRRWATCIERLLARCTSIDVALGESCFLASYERTPIGQHAQASRQAQN